MTFPSAFNVVSLKNAVLSMAGTQESLFSFELFVEYVRLHDRKTVEPAVAVRLLDFPTLLIYRSESEDSSGPFLQSDGNGVYCFNKGKSCLFKINLDSLYTHLSSTPLCTMVLDVRPDVPKLLGSSAISLAKLAACVKLAAEKHGILTPAAYGGKMMTNVLNLMGENIGTVCLTFKIGSFGASLIPHTPESEFCENDPSCPKPTVPEEKTKNGTDEIKPACSENDATNWHPAMMQSEMFCTQKPRIATVSTQTKHIKNKRTFLDAEGKFDDGQRCSTFHPPPLFYSNCEKNRDQHQDAAENDRMVNIATQCLRVVDLNTENENESFKVESACQTNGPRGVQGDVLLTNSREQQNQNAPSVLMDSDRQMLNALFHQVLHLNGQMQLQPLPFHPNAVNFISAQERCPAPASGKWSQTENVNAAASPVHRPIQPGSPGQRRNHEAPLLLKSSSLISQKKDLVVKKSDNERRKLRYGLTRSFHLRLKKIKPGLTRHHECREELKKNQVELQRKRSLTHKQDDISVIQNSDLDESVRPCSPSYRSHTSQDNREPDEYLDDFTSLVLTDGSPEPLSSPEPCELQSAQVSGGIKRSHSSSRRSQLHPVPVQTSPKCPLKLTHIIKTQLQSMALSESSDDSKSCFSRSSVILSRNSESRSCSPDSVSRIFEMCHVQENAPSRTRSVDKFQPSDDCMQESGSGSSIRSEEKRDKLGSLGSWNKYQPISELVVSKLPGYTL